MSAVAARAADGGRAAAELLRRRRARVSLEDYAQAVDVPGRPVSADPDAWMFAPVESPLALHHRVILRALQRCMTTRYGRLMIFAPPGSAKSSYASVVAPTWFMGARPGARVILASYATQIAAKQSRRARQICRSPVYRGIFGADLPKDQSAVEAWALTSGSELMAAGILAGITGNRADGLVIDDPVAGREEAESEAVRLKTLDAYQDDLQTRLVPGGWTVLMMTRWAVHDLAGMILPEDYDGRSGPVRCRDGMVWEVLRIPARADREDDPVGRRPGEYLWPEWFDAAHWRLVEDSPAPAARRTWQALYQQTPVVASGTLFRREWIRWYGADELPAHLSRYMASDFAVTAGAGDWTEHGVWGVCVEGDLWALDWWSGREATDTSIRAALALLDQHGPALVWYGERGVIEASIGPAIERAMAERRVRCARELLPAVGDKTARAQSFRAYCEAGRVHLPRGMAWAQRLLEQLVAFPTPGAPDDAVDVCGLIGRALDRLSNARVPAPKVNRAPQPFTEAWFDRQPDEAGRAARERYYR